jgi:exopolyphosphatase / guanosine-5'-triphosphate,3'-diphosphate pyrophosphatase
MTDSSATRRFAALDLGSLTVRLAVAQRTPAGTLKVLEHRREITGLGQGLAATGELTPEAMARTLKALKTFRQVMGARQVEVYRAVGTQALRQARNRQIFLDRLQDDLGLAVEVLTPEAEARLSLAGVLSVLDPHLLTSPVVVFDVGGGSSEFALVVPGQAPIFASLPLGVLALSQAHPLGDPPEPDKVSALKRDITAQLTTIYQESLQPHIKGLPHLVGTAGAVTTLAAMQLKMAVYDADQINHTTLSRGQVAALIELMARLPQAERGLLAGIEPAKAGVMIAGGLIILAILEVWGQDRLVVIDAGLLEAVLQELALKL